MNTPSLYEYFVNCRERTRSAQGLEDEAWEMYVTELEENNG